MEVVLEPGTYVVAVSGGVDSVVLLDALVSSSERHSFVVAHFDHGIRSDSVADREFVQGLAATYGLPFEYAEGHLGVNASEALAREARYVFLRGVQQKYQADAIVTAHHQDDVLETTILNLLRGTGRHGLASLKSTKEIRRPLLDIPKRELLEYARSKGLQWQEDSTNANPKYLRNYVRLHMLSRFSEADRNALWAVITQAADINDELDAVLKDYLQLQPAPDVVDRLNFILLRHAEAREVMAYWLRQQAQVELSRQLLERLVVAAKTGKSGSKVDVDGSYWLALSKERLHLQAKQR